MLDRNWFPKVLQKSTQNLPKCPKNLSKIVVRGRFWAPWGRLGGVLGRLGASLGVLGASWGVLWPSLGRLGSKKVANMAPTWSPKRSQNREKIEAKIDQNFDVSWGRIFERFWRIWEGKMEPSWHRNRAQNPCEHRNAILRKSCSHSCGGVNFLGSGVQVGSKNRSKNDVMMGWHLGIDFSWILVDFEGQVGAMLGSKIDQNSIQEGIEML